MDGVTLMDGTAQQQGNFSPIDCGKQEYVSSQQPWTVFFSTGINQRVPVSIRVYVASYSDDIDTPLVRFGSPGATPSYVVTLSPVTVTKPGSGSNVTPFLIPSISGSVGAPVFVGGKYRRPISITVNTSGLPTVPTQWAYQLLGFQDNDLTNPPIVATGIITDTAGGVIPAGPDGINTPHTFGPEDPTVSTSITVYAVAGIVWSEQFVPGSPPHTPGAFQPNNIVPGITASCVVTIGTTTGVTDPTAFVTSLLDTSVGVNSAVFGVLPLGIDTARIALLAVNTSQLANLAATAAKLAAGSVTAANGALAGSSVVAANMAANSITAGNAAIAALAVGTAAIQTAAITTALIATANITNALMASAAIGSANIINLAVGTGQIANLAVTTGKIDNLAVGTAQIANLAVTNAKINDLDVSKLNAGTISVAVSLTAPTITVTTGGTTINLDATNMFKVSKSGFSQQIGTAVSSGFGTIDGIVVTGSGSPAALVTISSLAINVGTTTGTGTFYSALSQSSLFVSNGAGSSTQVDFSGLTINATPSIRARFGTTPVTLANVISLLQYHGLCV